MPDGYGISRMSTSRFTVAQNSAITLATQIASYVLNFASSIIIARSLGPAGKGTLALVVLAHMLLLTVSNLGIASANAFLIAKRGYSLQQVSRHSLVGALVLGLGALVLTVAAIRFVPAHLVSPDQRGYILLAVGLVPVALARQFLSGALQGAGQIIWLNVLNLVQAVVNVANLALFLLVLRLGLTGGLTAWAVTTVAVSLLGIAVTFWRAACLRTPGDPGAAGWTAGLVTAALRYGIRAYPTGVVSFLNLRSDQFLLGYLAGSASVGQYSVAVTLAELLLFFPRSLATALLPRITGADGDAARHMAASACRHTIGGTAVSMAVLVPVGLLIPLFFGEAFRPSVVPFFILLPGLGLYSLVPVLSTYFSGQLGRPTIPSLLAALSLAIDLLLVWILVPILTVAGAALASTVAYTAAVLVMAGYFRRLTGVSLREMAAVRAGDLAAYRALLDPLLEQWPFRTARE